MTVEQHIRFLELMYSHGHRFFSVTFKRRNDKVEGGVVVAKAGEITKTTCRLHVKAHVKGVVPPEVTKRNDFANGLITVWSVERNRYTKIPLDGVVDMTPIPDADSDAAEKARDFVESAILDKLQPQS